LSQSHVFRISTNRTRCPNVGETFHTRRADNRMGVALCRRSDKPPLIDAQIHSSTELSVYSLYSSRCTSASRTVSHLDQRHGHEPNGKFYIPFCSAAPSGSTSVHCADTSALLPDCPQCSRIDGSRWHDCRAGIVSPAG